MPARMTQRTPVLLSGTTHDGTAHQDPAEAAEAILPSQEETEQTHTPRIVHEFFRRLVRDAWGRSSDQTYDIMRQASEDDNDDDASSQHKFVERRQAMSYDFSISKQKGDTIPCIRADEIVLPGSLLQQEMALKMVSAKYSSDSDVDECVICMEGFDASNPRMPTLCGCGENKTFFHLPCLYQWLEQSRDCPSCRNPLTWEEF